MHKGHKGQARKLETKTLKPEAASDSHFKLVDNNFKGDMLMQACPSTFSSPTPSLRSLYGVRKINSVNAFRNMATAALNPAVISKLSRPSSIYEKEYLNSRQSKLQIQRYFALWHMLQYNSAGSKKAAMLRRWWVNAHREGSVYTFHPYQIERWFMLASNLKRRGKMNVGRDGDYNLEGQGIK